VVELCLDDGPVVRAVAADGTAMDVGTRVETVLVPVAEGEDELLGLRVRPERAGGAA
jgi:hypothetical protein